MQEFSSISVSSYEAGSLADRLTEQSSAGWSVVSIVPTGSTITAYLSRDADAAADLPTHAGSADTATTDSVAAEATTDTADEASDAVAEAVETADETVADTTDAVADDSSGIAAAAAAVVEPSLPGSTPIVPEAATIDSGTGDSATIDSGTIEPGTVDSATIDSGTGEPGNVEITPAGAEAPSVAEPAAEPAAAQAAGAAPAGWYADPSGRFELRYWDGGQWTEHVSRAGQQYTDPPVA